MLRHAFLFALASLMLLTAGCGKRRVVTNIHETDMGSGDSGSSDAALQDVVTTTDGSPTDSGVGDGSMTPVDSGADAALSSRPSLIDCTEALPAAEVSMNFSSGFSPNSATIAPGQVALFVNSDPFAHTITSYSGISVVPSPDGRFDFDVASGESVCVLFPAAGTFPYYCTVHTSMRGQITVAAPGSGRL